MRSLVRTRCAFVIAAACLLAVGSVHGADWPQWRGPHRDGVAHGVTVPDKWPKTLKEEWRAEVGQGMSSPVVVGGKGYVFTRQKDEEVLLCFDVATGKEVWKSGPYEAAYTPGPGNPGDYKTRSTPTVADGRIFTLGIGGVFSCWEAKTGRLLWRKDPKQYPTYGASMSPLVVDGLCIVHLVPQGKGGLTAFDVASGEVKWSHADALGPPYASPILLDLAGERQAVMLTQGNFVGVSAATGKLLWQVNCPWVGSEKCITPVLYKDLIVFADTLQPLRAIRLERDVAKSTEKSDRITPKDVLEGGWPPVTHELAGARRRSLVRLFQGQGGPFLLPRRQDRKNALGERRAVGRERVNRERRKCPAVPD